MSRGQIGKRIVLFDKTAIVCLYFTKLAPIFKIADNVPRAERVVKRN